MRAVESKKVTRRDDLITGLEAVIEGTRRPLARAREIDATSKQDGAVWPAYRYRYRYSYSSAALRLPALADSSRGLQTRW